MYGGFSHSVIGAGHVKKKIVCQDSSAHKIGNGYAAAVVADGHGSKKHFRSSVGSACAVEAVLETLDRFYEDKASFEEHIRRNHEMIIRNIQKQVILSWNERIMAHYEQNPVTKAERRQFAKAEFEEIPVASYYGTTLVATIAGDGYLFGFQIGDGSLVAVFEDGSTEMLIDYEETNPANITASMCNSNAANMFGSYYLEGKQILAMFVSTDGLYTSFGSDMDFLHYHTIVTRQLSDPVACESIVLKNLTKRSHFGTEDDISFSCVYDKDLIPSRMAKLQQQIADYKQNQLARRVK